MSVQEEIDQLQPVKVAHGIRSYVAHDNPKRINITYYFNEKSGHVLARVRFGRDAQGPPGHAHGGALAAVLDESMGMASWMNDLMTMTAELNVSYLRAVPLERDFYIDAWVGDSDARKITIHSRLLAPDGKEHTRGKGLFIRQDRERFLAMLKKSGQTVLPSSPLSKDRK